MKKILIIMPSMFIGGAERSLLGLLDAFDYSKVEVSLFLYRHEGEFFKYIPKEVKLLPEMEEYRTFDVPVKSLFNIRQCKFFLARIYAKYLQKKKRKSGNYGTWMSMQMISKSLLPFLPNIPGKYDAAISFLGIPDVLVYKTKAKTKLAWNHTDYTTLGPDKEYDRELYSQIDYIASVSDECTKQFLKVYPEYKEKAITIENILSESLIKKQSKEIQYDIKKKENEIILLSIGRFCYAKNFDNIPEICSYIIQEGFQVKWYLIGYGSDEQWIRNNIKKYHMEDYVIILGKKENPYCYIKDCDLYIQPSRYEGKCVTVREAQILEKPVIITDYPTSCNQLKDGYDGFIVSLDNLECATSICQIVTNKELVDEVIQNMHKNDYSNKDALNELIRLI